MTTQMLTTDELRVPTGMDEIGVLQALVHRGDVVIVLDHTGELSGFYEANHGEHDRLLHVVPEQRWVEAAKLGEARLHNRGESELREFKLADVLQHRPVEEVGSLDAMLGREPEPDDELEGDEDAPD